MNARKILNSNVSTPASRLSRLEFTPTPFLKFMNIDNKCPSSEPFKCGLSPLQDGPRFPFRGIGAGTASGSLFDETLPEITFLDETGSVCSPCDSRDTLPTSIMATKENSAEAPPELSKHKVKGFWMDSENFPNITLLDLTSSDESPPRGEHRERTETSSVEDTPCSQPADIPVATETSLIKNPTSSAIQEDDSSHVLHSSTESRSLKISSGTTVEATVDLHNTTSEGEQPPTQSGSTTLSESSSSDNLQKTMDKPTECEPAPAESGSMALSESSSSDRLQKTMEMLAECEQPPTQTHSTTLSESSSSDNLQKTMDKHAFECEPPPTQSGSATFSESSSSDNLQKLMEKPTECEEAPAESGSMALSESSSSDYLQKTIDKHASECEPPPTPTHSATFSDSSSSDNLQKTMDKPTECEPAPAESGSVTLSESSSSDRLQKTMEKLTECEQPPTQTHSTTLSESSSSDNLQKTMDKHASECEPPPTQSGSATFSSSSDNLQKTMEKPTECEQAPAETRSTTLSESSSSDRLQKTIDKHASECEPPPAQTQSITFSESGTSVNLQKTTDRLPSPKICNLTTSLKECASEVQLPDQSRSKGTEPANNVKNPEGTFEVDPVLEAGRRETKAHRKSSLALTDVYDNSIIRENLNAATNKANTFNLDETLDLEVESLVTSTPIVNCKVFTEILHHAAGRNPAAQKRLLGKELPEPAAPVASEGPANIVGDRRTFLTRESRVAKPCLPPSKLSSQLLKNKSASTLPGRFQLATTGLPLTRQRAQTDACRNAIPSDAPKQTTGTSCTYNLRTTTTGLKLPGSSLRKPQESGIPSGIQRITRGLKMPAARGNALVPKKLCGPAAVPSAPCDAASRARALKPPGNGQRATTTKSQAPATNPAPKTIMAKKRLSPRNEALPSKKLKMDSVVSSSNPVNVALCPGGGPNAQTHGCANCAELEKQNKVMGEEIKRLNEELLKYKEDN